MPPSRTMPPDAITISFRRRLRTSLMEAIVSSSPSAVRTSLAAMASSALLLFAAFFLFGGGTTAGLQARYAAVDLAPAALRGRHLSLVIWATTVGAVAGPNLAPVAGVALQPYGVPTLAAPFLFSAVLLALAAVILLVWMRPDPMVIARAARDQQDRNAQPATKPSRLKAGLGGALAAVAADPAARLGISATVVGHMVMVGVMAMTPVHVLGAGHDAAQTLRIVGVLLSLHVAGMFAFAPVTGWLTDRFGRRPVILGAVLVLLAWTIAFLSAQALLVTGWPALPILSLALFAGCAIGVTRNRRLAAEIAIDERLNYIALEIPFEIQNVEREAEFFGHSASVVHVVKRAATRRQRIAVFIDVNSAPLIPQLHRKADQLMPLLLQNRGRGGRVNST